MTSIDICRRCTAIKEAEKPMDKEDKIAMIGGVVSLLLLVVGHFIYSWMCT